MSKPQGNNTMKNKIRDIPNPAAISIIFGKTITYVGWLVTLCLFNDLRMGIWWQL